ncbi:acyltransferase domain-containing protein [Micromonospora tarensis]|uniref:Acyltransferase domain-containing protein n=1 Tax=Micromonospora tarensis TaxID=2806100 RepID=A0ABS1YES8_9ACTN|nr:acyltransferase domain-containing protein [Micromonospora tarensis]MBM0275898.1 acyltransferase domain-containing protein [Micromonospora tarensis]
MISTASAVYLFPGQGGYSKGLLARVTQRYPATGDLFDEIADVAGDELGVDLGRLRTDHDSDAAELLRDAPDLLQFAIYAGSVLTEAALREAGAIGLLHIGHSFGEIAALTTAGACSVRDGARIVARRIQALNALSPDTGFMASVPVDRTRATALLDLLGDSRVTIAGQNEDQQVVIAGPVDAMTAACAVLAAAGVVSTRLPTPYPFHNAALQPAVAPFAAALKDITWMAPSIPVYSPILGRHYAATDDLPTLLAGHLVQPFAFHDSVRAAYANGHDVFVECGGRQVLTDITARVLHERSDWTAVATDDSCRRGVSAERVALLTGGVGPALVTQLRHLIGETSAEEFDRYWVAGGHDVVASSLRAGLAAFRASAGSTVAPPGGSAGATHPAPAEPAQVPVGGLDRGAVREQLARLYGDALEYPAEVFTEDVSLEADLGVDSVKQTDLLARAARHFGLPVNPDGFSVANYPTFGRVVDLITGSRTPTTV